MLNEEFLKSLLANEEVAADDKIKQILAEHEADTNSTTVGLLNKRDELLGIEKKLKEQISAYEAKNKDHEAKIVELNGLLEKATAGDKKAEEYYNAKLAEMKKKYDSELKEMTDQRDRYLKKHYESLEEKQFENAMKEITFVPELKEGFVARIRAMNKFEPKEMEGSIKFLNQESRTIEDVIKTFALSQEGKAYIANQSIGGGARGSSESVTSGTKTMTRSELTELQARDPGKASEFFLKGGRIEG